MIEILRPGPLCTIQDLGRPGYGRMGVAVSGAADRSSLRRANLLVHNDPGDACLEVTLGGLRFRALAEVTVAVTGAPCDVTVVSSDGERHAPDITTSFRLALGEQLHLSTPRSGLRSYVAIAGGIAVAPVLGSRATDVMSGLGPPVVTAGAVLPVGEPTISTAPAPGPVESTSRPLRVIFGPRDQWFDDAARDLLLTQPWTVTPQTNRVGIKLSGESPVPRSILDELPSEGMVPGAIQIPPSGQPVLFLVDHPVTGGYPVIAVVVRDDVDLAAQRRPGDTIRFAL